MSPDGPRAVGSMSKITARDELYVWGKGTLLGEVVNAPRKRRNCRLGQKKTGYQTGTGRTDPIFDPPPPPPFQGTVFFLLAPARGLTPARLGGWLVAWLVGCLVAWLLGCLVAWLLGCLVAWLLGRLVAWLVGWLVGRLVGWFVGWLAGRPHPQYPQHPQHVRFLVRAAYWA